jgi:hypothetical protein
MMARRRRRPTPGDWLFPKAAAGPDQASSLLDVLDNVLNKGAVVAGDVTLGVADVDLIYLKLSVLLSALDKAVKHMDFASEGQHPAGQSRKHRRLPGSRRLAKRRRLTRRS